MVELSDRVLNRTTLARQGLLVRSSMGVDEAVATLVGLQAQEPQDPYVALWSRLDRFDPAALSAGLSERRLVRIVVMRGTIHLVTASDALGLRPLMQPVLDAELARHPDAKGVRADDLAPALAWVRDVVASTPMSGTELRAAVAGEFPDVPPAAVAIAARCTLPMVQVPPRGLWRQGGVVRTTTAESWLGRPLASYSIDDVVVRYLAAFGPATVADVSAWCRLTGMREVVDRLVESGRAVRLNRSLVDVAGGVIVDGDTPAPVRFLPQYDNCLLSHADRSRFGEVRSRSFGHEVGWGSVLVDGTVQAAWKVADGRIEIRPHLPAAEAEARRLATFLT